jgi:hypothetical protein
MELQLIQNKIYTIRGCKVMIDFDLAEMYGIETRVLRPLRICPLNEQIMALVRRDFFNPVGMYYKDFLIR